jgi:hypothetical protein
LDADVRGISAWLAAEEETMETERPGKQDPEVVPEETGLPLRFRRWSQPKKATRATTRRLTRSAGFGI